MKSMKRGRFFLFIFAVSIFISAEESFANSTANSTATSSSVSCKDGSGKDLDGRIAVISIFADDDKTSWGKDRVNSYATKTIRYMDIATDWILRKVRPYGAEPEFIYNFFKNGGLYYKTKLDCDLTDWKTHDFYVWKYIREKIDLDWIKKTYRTDNFFFMVYVNTQMSNTIAPATRSFYKGMPYPYEIVYINRYRDAKETSPSVYAHEILHIFGARDLYYADSRNGFSKQFVDYCKLMHRNDIMYTISDIIHGGVRMDRITNDFSQLDAYYIGLINYCSEVEKFNLGKSEHLKHLE
ncbi:MAG: hypothetical protein IKP49_01900 [Treponema sp.]|nr:hypothetical protein [Treponema sp.]